MTDVGHVLDGTEGHVVITEMHGVTTLSWQAPTIDRVNPGVGTQFTAAFESSLPAPQAVFGTGPVCASVRAVDSRHALISSCVRWLFFWNMSAIVPVTCGAAIDVPPMVRYGSPPELSALADMIICPGAATVGAARPSRVGPRLELPERLPTPAPRVT
jgi:hypothetical protein